MSHQPKPIYEFGPYRLDAAERRLLRDSAVVPLQPKVFDLLLALLERHGLLVEKDELMKAVWPDPIVEEVNFANNISILSKTISENGQQFIEKAPKRGYCFVAEAREVGGNGLAQKAHSPIVIAEKIQSIEEAGARRYHMKRIKTPLTIKAITQSQSMLNQARLSKVSPNFS